MNKNIFKYKDLIFELVKRDIKKKYRRSILGILWSMLNPFFIMLITTMVFSNFFRFAIENFPLYLFSGQLIFNFYSEATNTAMDSMIENAPLIKKVYIPKYVFPIAKVLSSFVNFVLSLPGLFLIMFITKVPFTLFVFDSILPITYLLFFCIGIGLILTTCAVFFRDMFHIYTVLLTGLNYITPLFYPVDIIPDKFQFLLKFNPLYYYVQLYRNAFYYGVHSPLSLHIKCIIMAFLACIIGFIIFNEKQDKFILYI